MDENWQSWCFLPSMCHKHFETLKLAHNSAHNSFFLIKLDGLIKVLCISFLFLFHSFSDSCVLPQVFRAKWLINAQSTQPLCWLVNSIFVSVMKKVTDWIEKSRQGVKNKARCEPYTWFSRWSGHTLLPSIQWFLFTCFLCISALLHTALS